MQKWGTATALVTLAAGVIDEPAARRRPFVQTDPFRRYRNIQRGEGSRDPALTPSGGVLVLARCQFPFLVSATGPKALPWDVKMIAQQGSQTGRRDNAYALDRLCAVFWLGPMHHWNCDRGCKPAQLVERLGWIRSRTEHRTRFRFLGGLAPASSQLRRIIGVLVETALTDSGVEDARKRPRSACRSTWSLWSRCRCLCNCLDPLRLERTLV